MKKKVYIIHTSFVSVDHLKMLFAELVPEAQVFHIVDDSLLNEIMENGGVTPAVTRRYCMYAIQAESQGADLIFSQCSSAGSCADIASQMVKTPILKVDQAMAEEAVKIGGRIAVAATLETTLKPSMKLISDEIEKSGSGAVVIPVLVKGAFDELINGGGKAVHNEMVLQKIRETAKTADVITLAQGSMVSLLDELEGIDVPVLTSPRMGVQRVRTVLGL